MNYDAIVVGGGHNGLTTAALLAKRGRRVLLLERRAVLGGLAAAEEFHPGYRTQGVLLDTEGLRRWVVSELRLEEYGLRLRDSAPPVYVPQTGGPGLVLHREPGTMAADRGKGLSDEDARRYHDYRAFLARIRPFIRFVLDRRPPPLSDRGVEGLLQLARAGMRLRGLGERDMIELLRVAPMCAGDWLGDWFSSDLLKTALAAPALEASFLGPWSAGTVANLLLREAAHEAPAHGGPAAVAAALEKAGGAAGAELATGAAVTRIRVANGTVVGVATADGRNYDAPVVASACDPRRTFLELVDPIDLPVSLEDQARVFRMRGTTAKVNLALSGPLEFPARPGERFERIRTGEHLDDLERAFDAVKYGEFSERPALEVRVPTVADPSLAPAGHHTAELLVHFAPYALKAGWSAATRAKLGDAAVAALARYAPGLPERIVAREVLSPLDIEERYGATQGHLHHGEPFLDQLYAMRPSPDCARYATPIEGLFLCGPGCHPGGGITCAPGALAAEAILQHG